MTVEWDPHFETAIADAIDSCPLGSGKCAVVSRVVDSCAEETDRERRGLRFVPRTAARYLLARDPEARLWEYHVLTEVEGDCIDAFTGPPGHPFVGYLDQYFEAPAELRTEIIDVWTVDVGMEDDS